jgi:hypothetical protein
MWNRIAMVLSGAVEAPIHANCTVNEGMEDAEAISGMALEKRGKYRALEYVSINSDAKDHV